MIRILAVVAAAGLVLAGCAAGAQAASVELASCAVSGGALKPGAVTFSLHNATADEVSFAIREDKDTHEVGLLLVHPGQTAPLTVTFDAGDEYVTHCGDMKGPVYKP